MEWMRPKEKVESFNEIGIDLGNYRLLGNAGA